MMTSRPNATLSNHRGRRHARPLWALAAAAWLLAGCASGGTSPLGEAISQLVDDGTQAGERAAGIRYASLALDSDTRRGLVVLGTAAGETTYWPTGNEGVLVLYRDGLQATSGFSGDLLATRYLPLAEGVEGDAYVPWQEALPGAFRVERHWLEADGTPRQLGARGELHCSGHETLTLPLGTRRLQRCDMTLAWESGETTRSTLWREPESFRLWAAEERPWPGGPWIEWQVARAWW